MEAVLKVHQAVARDLIDRGGDTLFGPTRDANMNLVNSFKNDFGGDYVSAAHEVGAAAMALGYAAFSKKPGVCSVTFGPGLTNTLTGLLEGVRGRSPLVLMTGDTPVEDREN